jgi:hypothetical protein
MSHLFSILSVKNELSREKWCTKRTDRNMISSPVSTKEDSPVERNVNHRPKWGWVDSDARHCPSLRRSCYVDYESLVQCPNWDRHETVRSTLDTDDDVSWSRQTWSLHKHRKPNGFESECSDLMCTDPTLISLMSLIQLTHTELVKHHSIDFEDSQLVTFASDDERWTYVRLHKCELVNSVDNRWISTNKN